MTKGIARHGAKSILEILGLEKKNSMGASLFGALRLVSLGAVAGVGLGLLLAPRSGRAMRHDLGRRAKQGVLRAAGRGQDMLESTQMAGA